MIKSRKMKTYYLKIRERFIESLRTGVKKHEYRLASPERRMVKIGDNLVLISNLAYTVQGETSFKFANVNVTITITSS